MYNRWWPGWQIGNYLERQAALGRRDSSGTGERQQVEPMEGLAQEIGELLA